VGRADAVTAATREVLQSHFGAATLKSNPEEYLQKDFAALMETMALGVGHEARKREQERADGIGALIASACSGDKRVHSISPRRRRLRPYVFDALWWEPVRR